MKTLFYRPDGHVTGTPCAEIGSFKALSRVAVSQGSGLGPRSSCNVLSVTRPSCNRCSAAAAPPLGYPICSTCTAGAVPSFRRLPERLRPPWLLGCPLHVPVPCDSAGSVSNSGVLGNDCSQQSDLPGRAMLRRIPRLGEARSCLGDGGTPCTLIHDGCRRSGANNASRHLCI